MATIVGWFPSVAPVRDAVLDLLTSGVPRPRLSIIMNAFQGEPAPTGAVEPPADAEAAVEAQGLPDFVAALADAGPLTLADAGPVLAAGPIAGELAAGADRSLHDALVAHGIAADHADLYAADLRRGGALLLVESDDTWDTIVEGVFRHANNPALRAQAEPEGPAPEDLAQNEYGATTGTSAVGALTGGLVPGGWGDAGVDLETDFDERAADQAPAADKGASGLRG
jgi:hypothetical protein